MMQWDHHEERIAALERALAMLQARLDAQGASAILLKLDKMEKLIMATAQDFQNAMNRFSTTLDSIGTGIDTLIAAHNASDPAAWDAAVASLGSAQSKADADLAKLAAASPTPVTVPG